MQRHEVFLVAGKVLCVVGTVHDSQQQADYSRRVHIAIIVEVFHPVRFREYPLEAEGTLSIIRVHHRYERFVQKVEVGLNVGFLWGLLLHFLWLSLL